MRSVYFTLDIPHNSKMVHFYCTALNSGWSSQEKVVRPSVCLSVKRVHCDKMEERSVQIFIPYERSFSLVSRDRMSVSINHQ